MGIIYKYLPEKGIIEIEIKGRLSYDIAKNYSMEAQKLGRENHCSKYLFDHSNTTLTKGIQRIYTDGAVLEQFGFKVTDKIAILIKCKKDNPLLLNEGRNNIKWSNCRYFSSYSKASSWLIKDS